MVNKSLVLLMTVAGVWTGVGLAADWPQWRGLNRDGVWTETGLVERFEAAQLPIQWRVALGSGYCGPTVAEGRVFVMDRVLKPTPQERIQCFEAQTGNLLWSHAYLCAYERIQYEAGPRASVTIHAGRAYALGTMGHLHCFDAQSGKVLWSRDGRKEYAARVPIWGIAGAPLVEGDLLIAPVGGKDNACLMAFDTATGQEKWRALKEGVSYSAPIVITQAGRRVLVYITDQRIVGLDPQTGQLHWEHPFVPKEMEITIATPVFDGRHLVVTSFYDGMVVLTVNPDRLAVEPLW